MIRRITTTLLALASVLIMNLGIVVPAIAASDAAKKAACDSISGTYNASTGECVTGSVAGEQSINALIAKIISIFSWIVGVVAVIFVMYGGFRYITSGGDSSKVTGAKNTIVYALIGLVVAVLAQVIVQLVLNKIAP